MSVSAALPVGLSALTAFLLTWTGVSLLRALAPRWGFIDIPNERSSHQRPTPRAGGLAFVVAVPVVAVAASSCSGIPTFPGEAALLLGGTLVAAVGLVDDRRGLPVRVRLVAYLAAAAILTLGAGWLDELQWPGGPGLVLGWLGLPLTILWIAGLTNIYNFMDGIDGIAAAQAVVAAGAAASLALWVSDGGLALFAAVLSGAAAGFLLHNRPPARIFMGDVGSAFLGYTFAGLAVLSGRAAAAPVPFALWLVLLAPFLFDASLTLAVRVARGERWYEAHRQHLYQRLVRLGWSHLAVTTVYLCADLVLAGIALAYRAIGLDGGSLALATSLPLVGILGLVRWAEGGGATPFIKGRPRGEQQ